MNDSDLRYCHIHKCFVTPFYSAKTKKWYCKHVLPDGKTCWVNTEAEMDGFREKQIDYANDQRGAV